MHPFKFKKRNIFKTNNERVNTHENTNKPNMRKVDH